MAQSVDTVVCTELHVTKPTTNDDQPRNDTTQYPADISPTNSVEVNEEALNESTPLITNHQDATIQADQAMETSHTTPDNLLDISNSPVMVAHATVDFIGRKSNNFLKGCKWYNHPIHVEVLCKIITPGLLMDHAFSPVVMIIS